MIAHIDFESRSAIDLTKVGVDLYANHHTTSVWCMAVGYDNEETLIHAGGHLPDRLRDHVKAGGLVYAHNASFEFSLWNLLCVPRYGWPPLKLEQMRCTMAMGYAMSLPGALAFIAPAVGIEVGKDMDGRRLMLQMAKPRRTEEDGTHIWWDDGDRRSRLFAYCRQDVVVERDVHSRIRELSPDEQALWVLDQEINLRGIHVDIPSIKLAIDAVEKEKAKLDARMISITNEAVMGCTKTLQLADWLTESGVKNTGVAKADVIELLERKIPIACRKALLLRQEAGRSSTSKLDAMLLGASEDNRVRGTMQFHGAGTGRWAGRKIQPHNFPRPAIKQHEIEDIIDNLGQPEYIEMMYGGIMEVLPSCLRGMITGAPGHDLIAADFSNIEGRVLAWLAGEEWKLEAFRDYDSGSGPDIYKLGYSKSFHIDPGEVTADQRQVGKVQELALGFGGGVGAFQQMARSYGVDVADSRAEEIKTAWREAHKKIVKLWYRLEKDSQKALLTGKKIDSGPVQWKLNGSFLWCRLPSGRLLCYPYPKMQLVKTPWGDMKEALTYMGVDAVSKKWVRISTYGGKLAENITQAAARDILSESMKRLDAKGYPIVFHVHDENVCEMKEGEGSLKEVEAICSEVPAWAKGLPISAEGWRGKRYRK